MSTESLLDGELGGRGEGIGKRGAWEYGFFSSWEAWVNYLGPDGFLARTGLKGFAVGDGQVSGTMNIDRVMQERDVAQLIMLGSPMAGTDRAELPVALEIRSSYVQDIFNRQITHRQGVPFRALAGVPILEAFKSPCTEVPTDVAVSLKSMTAITLEAEQMPVLHTELNQSQQVFDEFVKPRLQTLPGGYPQEPEPIAIHSSGRPSTKFPGRSFP